MAKDNDDEGDKDEREQEDGEGSGDESTDSGEADTEAEAVGSEVDDSDGDEDASDGGDDDDDDENARPSLSAKEMTLAAMEALQDLTGHEPEAATGLMYDGESWLVTVDVLELSRIPNTTDLLATYVVQLDGDGNLSGYKRTRRFQRSQAEEG